jgi:hypothetical protein
MIKTHGPCVYHGLCCYEAFINCTAYSSLPVSLVNSTFHTREIYRHTIFQKFCEKLPAFQCHILYILQSFIYTALRLILVNDPTYQEVALKCISDMIIRSFEISTEKCKGNMNSG